MQVIFIIQPTDNRGLIGLLDRSIRVDQLSGGHACQAVHADTVMSLINTFGCF